MTNGGLTGFGGYMNDLSAYYQYEMEQKMQQDEKLRQLMGQLMGMSTAITTGTIPTMARPEAKPAEPKLNLLLLLEDQ